MYTLSSYFFLSPSRALSLFPLTPSLSFHTYNGTKTLILYFFNSPSPPLSNTRARAPWPLPGILIARPPEKNITPPEVLLVARDEASRRVAPASRAAAFCPRRPFSIRHGGQKLQPRRQTHYSRRREAWRTGPPVSTSGGRRDRWSDAIHGPGQEPVIE